MRRILSSMSICAVSLAALGACQPTFRGERDEASFISNLDNHLWGWRPSSAVALGAEITIAAAASNHDGSTALASGAMRIVNPNLGSAPLVVMDGIPCGDQGAGCLALKAADLGAAQVEWSGMKPDQAGDPIAAFDLFSISVRPIAAGALRDPLLPWGSPDESLTGALWSDSETPIAIAPGPTLALQYFLRDSDALSLGYDSAGERAPQLVSLQGPLSVTARDTYLHLMAEAAQVGSRTSFEIEWNGAVQPTLFEIDVVDPSDAARLQLTVQAVAGLYVIKATPYLADERPLQQAPIEWSHSALAISQPLTIICVDASVAELCQYDLEQEVPPPTVATRTDVLILSSDLAPSRQAPGELDADGNVLLPIEARVGSVSATVQLRFLPDLEPPEAPPSGGGCPGCAASGTALGALAPLWVISLLGRRRRGGLRRL